MKTDTTTVVMAVLLSAGTVDVPAEELPCGGTAGIQLGKEHRDASRSISVHHAVAVVHAVNKDNGTVSVVHEPVRSLNWPAMTKTFVVEDRKLFDSLVSGKKVCIEFEKRRTGYFITAVR